MVAHNSSWEEAIFIDTICIDLSFVLKVTQKESW